MPAFAGPATHAGHATHGAPLSRRLGRPAYVLLEVVIAAGLLVVALSIIGAQIQDSGSAIQRMERRLEAVRLAEEQFAYLDLGLVDWTSADEVQEGDFGPRFPDWAWRITTEPAAVDGIFRLRLEILHFIREEEYKEDDFPYDDAESVFAAYALRAVPQKLDLAADFGLSEDELTELTDKMQESGLPFDPNDFNPAMLADADFEQLITSLPLLLDAMGLELGDLQSVIPADLLQELKDQGLLGDENSEGEGEGP